MKFNIAGFTHKGTGIYKMNEDRILINGQVLSEGELYLPGSDSCICFVSDGVGGTHGGGFASTFLLERLKDLNVNIPDDFINKLYTINRELFDTVQNKIELKGCACTLSGIIASDTFVDFYQIGDSEMWVLRDDMLIKITTDEVLEEDYVGSPITNYFGGDENNLEINTIWEKPEILPGDSYLICSDGLYKSLNVKLVKSILNAEKNTEVKILKLKENVTNFGSEDNVSAIIIEVLEV
jgi:serine/threonine protein phosphatase PrpC